MIFITISKFKIKDGAPILSVYTTGSMVVPTFNLSLTTYICLLNKTGNTLLDNAYTYVLEITLYSRYKNG